MLPPVLLTDEKQEKCIITLTNEGVLTAVAVSGELLWTKNIGLRWSDFDERMVGNGVDSETREICRLFPLQVIGLVFQKFPLCLLSKIFSYRQETKYVSLRHTSKGDKPT